VAARQGRREREVVVRRHVEAGLLERTADPRRSAEEVERGLDVAEAAHRLGDGGREQALAAEILDHGRPSLAGGSRSLARWLPGGCGALQTGRSSRSFSISPGPREKCTT